MYYTTKEVSELLSISTSTVKRYSDTGHFKYIRIGDSGHRRYLKESIEEYIIDQKSNASKDEEALNSQSIKKIGKLVANPHPKHYLMHKYWGRKAHNIVSHYIEYFTRNGDVVLDPFMGSGVSVIEAIKLNRKAIGVDLNPMSVKIVSDSLENIDFDNLSSEFNKINDRIKSECNTLYETNCPNCGRPTLFDCAVWEGDKLKSMRGVCQDHGKFIKKPDDYDLDKFKKAKNRLENLEGSIRELIPTDKIPQYVRRSNKTNIDQLFSERALLVLANYKKEINKVKSKKLREVLNFVFTSALANTSKMLPGDEKKASYKSGWVISKFWVPKVHAERNAIDCISLRFNAIYKGKRELSKLHSKDFKLHNRDAKKLPVKTNSVDYIFTDPPYGESIAYFSLSHLWNTWLGNSPKFEEEIIVDPYRKKDYEAYAQGINKAYKEMFRVLKPGSFLSFTFHNRDLNVWKAIVDACTLAGFEFVSAVLQEQAVGSGTQGINRNNTLRGDFVYTYVKPKQKKKNKKKIEYHKSGEVLIINEVQKHLEENGILNSSDLYEFLIPLIIKHNAILNTKGEVINLEKLLLQHFDYVSDGGSYKWDLKNRVKEKKKYNVLDLFAGAGGMSSGFSKAGFNVIAAVEYDGRIKDTFLYNHSGTHLIVDDIKNVSVNQDIKNSNIDLGELFEKNNLECDVIVGGPPCQGFSMAGKRIRKSEGFFDDERNFLFLEYYRVVSGLRPKVFVIENVPGILNYRNGTIRQEIIDKFQNIGYEVQTRVLLAAEYGVPQLRKRAFFIGNRIGVDSNELFPEPKLDEKNYVTVWEAIGDLPEIKPGDNPGKIEVDYYRKPFSDYQKEMRINSGYISNHSSSNPNEKTIEILKMIKEGQGLKDLPPELRTRSVHSGAYGRMSKSKPAFTITTRINTPSVGCITHPVEHRTITPREAARIQSFDDSYVFFGNITSLGIQIGNAVPPKLAEAIAKKIMVAVEEKSKKRE